jgi:hypothetical protein
MAINGFSAGDVFRFCLRGTALGGLDFIFVRFVFFGALGLFFPDV